MLKLKLALLCWCFLCLECAPMENKYQKQVPTDEALKFMKKYGYLVDDDGQSEAIYSEENLSNIIKTMQKFGGIEETGVIDNSTLKLMSSPRCGVPDIIKHNRVKRYNVVDGWNKRNITYYIANWSPRLGEITVAKNIQKALDIWGLYGHLRFTRSEYPNADIIVSFARGYHGDRYPFDGPGNVLAHAFFPYDYEGPSEGGDIHFDDEENWVEHTSDRSEEEGGTDFFSVALHELGHSLGLAHSAVVTSVMFPYYKGPDANTQNYLDYDDVLGMYNLYISRRLKHDDNIPFNPPTPTTTRHTTNHREQETTTSTPVYCSTSTTHYDERQETTRHPSKRRNPWYGPRLFTTTASHDEQHTRVNEETTTTTTTESYDLPPRRRNEGTTISYEGDNESVDDHKEHDPNHKIPKNNSPSLPFICDGHFDAVATLRDELFIFKDEYIWRLREMGDIVPGYPVPLRQMFPDLPKNIKKVDAAYQRPDGHIVLFTGNKLWIHDGARFVENSPLPLSYYTLPDYLDSIDAVQTWAKNGKTYFYKNDRIWRYDDNNKTMDPGYPMSMDRWRGVPPYLDSATTWKGITYFFKGELFWKFDNDWIIATESSPLPIAPIWLGCKEEELQMKRLFGN